jgi:hypothetical protein
MHPERPLSSVSDNHLSYYQSSHSTTRTSDIPTRLSGWFQHAFNSSSTDLRSNPPPSHQQRPPSHLLWFPQVKVVRTLDRSKTRQGPPRQGNALPPRQRFYPRQVHRPNLASRCPTSRLRTTQRTPFSSALTARFCRIKTGSFLPFLNILHPDYYWWRSILLQAPCRSLASCILR